MDPDKAQHFVRPDVEPICLQKLSADDISRQIYSEDTVCNDFVRQS